MPHLVLFGRGWDFSSDDFGHGGWTLVVINAINAGLCFSVALSPDVANLVCAVFGFTGGCSICSALLNSCLATASSRGPILDPSPRVCVACLLRAEAFLVSLQVLGLVGETVAYSKAETLGSQEIRIVILLGIHWLSLLVCILVCISFVTPLPNKLRFVIHGLSLLLCKPRDDQDMLDVHEALRSFLNDTIATTSDAVAAKLLVSNVQRAARHGKPAPTLSALRILESDGFPWTQDEEKLLEKSKGGDLPGTTPITDRVFIEELLHYLCYGTAVCGILLHLFSGRGSLKRADSFGKSPTYTHAAHVRAIMATLQEWPGHASTKLIYLSEMNNVKCTLYAVFVTNERRDVVISVRGTLSISDAITDLLATPAVVTDTALTGDGAGPFYVHSGMWEAAKNVLNDIDSRGSLACLLSGGNGQDLPDCRGFRVIVTGHSLGSGTGQLLTALLRPNHPEIQFFGYGSPHPWSEAFAQYMSPHMTQVINGDDVIPRLSIRNAELLRDRMLALIAHCTWPKNRIFRRVFLRTFSEAPWEEYISSQVVSDFAKQRLISHSGKSASPRFYHAGQIVYLRVLETEKGCCGATRTDTKFRAEWAENDHFMEMVVSRKMMVQHMPDNYRRALELVLRDLSDPESTTFGERLA